MLAIAISEMHFLYYQKILNVWIIVKGKIWLYPLGLGDKPGFFIFECYKGIKEK